LSQQKQLDNILIIQVLEESNNMDEEKMAWIACMESYAYEKE